MVCSQYGEWQLLFLLGILYKATCCKRDKYGCVVFRHAEDTRAHALRQSDKHLAVTQDAACSCRCWDVEIVCAANSVRASA